MKGCVEYSYYMQCDPPFYIYWNFKLTFEEAWEWDLVTFECVCVCVEGGEEEVSL